MPHAPFVVREKDDVGRYRGHLPVSAAAWQGGHHRRSDCRIVAALGVGSGVGPIIPILRAAAFYELPGVCARIRGATAHEMAEKEAMASFSAPLNAAHLYLAAGFPLQALNPRQRQRLHLLDLPPSSTAPFRPICSGDVICGSAHGVNPGSVSVSRVTTTLFAPW